MERWLYRIQFYALLLLGITLFTTFTGSAAFHILMVIPSFYFLYKSLKDRTFFLPQSSYFLLALMAAGIASITENQNIIHEPLLQMLKMKYYFMGLINIWALHYLIRNYLSSRKIRILISTALICASAASLSGIFAIFLGHHPFRLAPTLNPNFASGMFASSVSYGHAIGLFSLLVFGMLILYRHIRHHRLGSLLLFLVFFINTAGLVLSHCRSAVISFLMTFPFLFAKKSKPLIVLFFGAALSFICILFLNSTQIQNMFLNSKSIESYQKRYALVQTAIAVVKEKPFFGIGYKNFIEQVPNIKRQHKIDFPKDAGDAHNNIIEHMASTGLVGMLLFVLFQLFWLIETYHRRDIVGYLVIPFILYFMISGLTYYSAGDGKIMFLVMLIYSLSQAIPRRHQYVQSESKSSETQGPPTESK